MFSRDFNKQVDCLDKVLTWIGSGSLKLKGSKYVLFSTKVSFLGHNLWKEKSCWVQKCGQDPELASTQDNV